LESGRQIAFRSHQHRQRVRPGFQYNHGKPFAEGRQDERIRMLVGRGFRSAELWPEEVHTVRQVRSYSLSLQLRLVPALIPASDNQVPPLGLTPFAAPDTRPRLDQVPQPFLGMQAAQIKQYSGSRREAAFPRRW